MNVELATDTLARTVSTSPFAFCAFYFAWLPRQQPEPPPIIVKLIEPDNDPIGLADVVIGALGLSGALAVCAILLGVAAGGRALSRPLAPSAAIGHRNSELRNSEFRMLFRIPNS